MSETNNGSKSVSSTVLFKMKSLMKEVLNHGKEFLEDTRYKLFKSYIMYSTYYNYRTLADKLVEIGVLEKNNCSCRLEKRKEEQSKTCRCENTEYVESELFKQFKQEQGH